MRASLPTLFIATVAFTLSLACGTTPPDAQAPTRLALDFEDYAALPITAQEGGTNTMAQLARVNYLRDEPGGRRFFVNDLNGPLYILDKQTRQFTTYLDFNGLAGRPGLFPKFTFERNFATGLTSFAFDPDYVNNGIFYTLHMEDPSTPASAAPRAGVVPGLDLTGYRVSTPITTPTADGQIAREVVLIEWTDGDTANATFEGTARELMRLEHWLPQHPLGDISFNPVARPGDADWRVMYLGVGDSGYGDRGEGIFRLTPQRLDSLAGKILRIVPDLGAQTGTSTVSPNGRYRIPDDNPFTAVEGARGEVWAYGLRNPHRLIWDTDSARPAEPRLLAFHIGLVTAETIVVIHKGANYGWPLREGTLAMSPAGAEPLPEDDAVPVRISDTVTRGTITPTYPVAQYSHDRATGGDGIANGFVYTGRDLPALRDKLIFGDITVGRIWYADIADIRAADNGRADTLAPIYEVESDLRGLVEETYRARGGAGDQLPGMGAVSGPGRVDIRFAVDEAGELYVLTKSDGMIRRVVGAREVGAAVATAPVVTGGSTSSATAAAGPAPVASMNPVTPTPASIARGKELYDLNCANCHGDRAQGAVKAGFEISIITERGGPQPSELTDETWDHGSSDSEIAAVIKMGIPSGMMASYEGRLSDAEIGNIVAYLRSLSSAPPAPPATRPTTAASSTTERTLELADYFELPITGDMSADRVSGVLARGSILRDEPGSRERFFINDLTGRLYMLDKRTKALTTYLDFTRGSDGAGLFPKFSAAQGYAAGLMNFVFDPEYTHNGIFYTLHMEDPNRADESAAPRPGVVPGLDLSGYTISTPLPTPMVPNPTAARDMVIVEWTDRQLNNTTFEGTAREVLRMKIPGLFHPLNELIFNPAARPGDPDWRVMYLGVGDSGTGERPGPMRMHSQRLDNFHGKILRVIPMLDEHTTTSTVSENGRYRIPNDNPFVGVEGARPEIWAYGLRNPHRMTWYVDAARPREAVLLAFNIGLVTAETVMIVRKGANYGYPLREGARRMSETNGMGPIPADDTIPVQISDTVTRGTVRPTYAVAAYPHAPGGGDAIANGFVYRGARIPALQGALIFGDITTGRLWYARMDDVLAADDGDAATMAPIHELGTPLRVLTEETYRRRGGRSEGLPGRGAVEGRGRIDLRLAEDENGELYLITKGDGMIREVRGMR